MEVILEMDNETRELMQQGGVGSVDPANAPFPSFAGAPPDVVAAPRAPALPPSAYLQDGQGGGDDWTPLGSSVAVPSDRDRTDMLLTMSPEDFDKIGLVVLQYDGRQVDLQVAADDLREVFDELMKELMAQLSKPEISIATDPAPPSADTKVYQHQIEELEQQLNLVRKEAADANDFIRSTKPSINPDSLRTSLMREFIARLELQASEMMEMADEITATICE